MVWQTNRFAGTCRDCGLPVDPGEGEVDRGMYGQWVTRHSQDNFGGGKTCADARRKHAQHSGARPNFTPPPPPPPRNDPPRQEPPRQEPPKQPASAPPREEPAIERLIKVLGMTGSDQDGEALAAIRRANKIISDAGWSWNDLLRSKVKITIVEDPFKNIPEPQQRRAAPPPPSPTPPTPSAPPPPKSPPWTAPPKAAQSAPSPRKPKSYNGPKRPNINDLL